MFRQNTSATTTTKGMLTFTYFKCEPCKEVNTHFFVTCACISRCSILFIYCSTYRRTALWLPTNKAQKRYRIDKLIFENVLLQKTSVTRCRHVNRSMWAWHVITLNDGFWVPALRQRPGLLSLAVRRFFSVLGGSCCVLTCSLIKGRHCFYFLQF